MSNRRIKWYEVDNSLNTKIPLWALSFGISDDGIVFIPAAIGGNEQEVYLCTLFDATPSCCHLEHYFVPLTWLSSNYPKSKPMCDSIQQSILRSSFIQ